MDAVSVNSLTAVGALATAVFTGITAVVTYLVYQHGRHQAAQRRPIRVRNEGFRCEDEITMLDLPPAIKDSRPKRIVVLRFSASTRWSGESGF